MILQYKSKLLLLKEAKSKSHSFLFTFSMMPFEKNYLSHNILKKLSLNYIVYATGISLINVYHMFFVTYLRLKNQILSLNLVE